MTSPIIGNDRKERLMFFGASRASERLSKDVSNDLDEGQGVLGIVLQGRVVKKILHGSQAYYCKVIALKDEIVAIGVNYRIHHACTLEFDLPVCLPLRNPASLLAQHLYHRRMQSAYQIIGT
jgi:hypothetical protein